MGFDLGTLNPLFFSSNLSHIWHINSPQCIFIRKIISLRAAATTAFYGLFNEPLHKSQKDKLYRAARFIEIQLPEAQNKRVCVYIYFDVDHS